LSTSDMYKDGNKKKISDLPEVATIADQAKWTYQLVQR
jgi:hypothetical protein